nr:myomesin-2-like isoform X2 [Oncorhynchus nerka]
MSHSMALASQIKKKTFTSRNKDGTPLGAYGQAWNYSLKKKFGLNSLEIRSISRSRGHNRAILDPNCNAGAGGSIEFSFPPTWVKEGENLTLQCAFSSALLPFQQDVAWFRDGVQLRQSSCVELKTALRSASLTPKGVHKEQEGMYMVRLRTWKGVKEHKAYIFVKDASAVVSGGPGSPLALKVSDVQKDYVFLTCEPPSADGAYQVEGYFVERCDIGSGQWLSRWTEVERSPSP